MSTRWNVFDRTAERLVNSEGADRVDERERSITMEAHSFGMQASVIAFWLGALILAVLGEVVATLVLIIAPLVPTLCTMWYSKRRGVDSWTMMSRAPLSRTLGWTVFYGVILLLTIAALIYRAYFGAGMWDVSIGVEVVGEDLQQVMAISALGGACLGLLLGAVWVSLIVWNRRRAEQRDDAEHGPELD